MHVHHTEAVLEQDGTLTLRDLPFHAGEAVEVIVLARSPASPAEDRYPLRGTPLRYDEPTAPVAPEDWDAAR